VNHKDRNVIETHKLSKSFGKVHALQNVNLKVPRNSIFGFLGPNGAGKTTMMKILLGLSHPTQGTGTIFGLDIVNDSIAIRERIGYLPQHPRFIEQMSARENLEFTAKFFKDSKLKIQERCDEMLELVGLQDKADRSIKGFSGGEKQRLGIALAQVNYPDLLILDEPASALDPFGRKTVLEIMERLRKHTTIFFSTHILDDVQRVSDSVAILNNGGLVVCGPIEQILNRSEGVFYSLNVKDATNPLDKLLDKVPWVSGVYLEHHNGTSTWQISVSDEVAAERDLLRLILSDPKVRVTEFHRKKFELEEKFMEIVKGDGNVN